MYTSKFKIQKNRYKNYAAKFLDLSNKKQQNISINILFMYIYDTIVKKVQEQKKKTKKMK